MAISLALGAAIICRTAPLPETAPGTMVKVGDHLMHFHCAGWTNSPVTVLFESGGGGDARDWSRVRERLRPDLRTFAYDRAGSGWSEPGPGPRTLNQETYELHALLGAANISGPLLLVGQSIGGLLVRLYAEHFGSNVVGVVLVDPTDENGMLGSARYGGWVRLREKATGRPIPAPKLIGEPETATDRAIDYLAEEFQQIYLARQTNAQPLGDRPLIVLAAGKRERPPGTPDEFWEKLLREKESQLLDQAGLSRRSRLIPASTSGHAIQRDNPGLVARAIEEVVVAIQHDGQWPPERTTPDTP
ncbi:MAG: alpha/beta hydrolase [Verrucomicrobiota bacterium]